MFEEFGDRAWPRAKRFYREQWLFFNRFLRKYFLLALTVFLVFSVAGFIFYAARPERAGRDVRALAERLAGGLPPDASPGWLFLHLFWNNFRAAALGLAVGIIPFLSLPAVGAAANGIALGLVAAFAGQAESLGTARLAAGILPHGILELPAVWLADAMGIFLCLEIGRRIRKPKRAAFGVLSDPNGLASPETALPADPRDDIFLGDLVVTFGAVVVPLLLVAAAVEAFVTPLLLGRLG